MSDTFIAGFVWGILTMLLLSLWAGISGSEERSREKTVRVNQEPLPRPPAKPRGRKPKDGDSA